MRPLVRSGPRPDLLAVIEVPEGGDGPHRVVGTLVVPRADRGVVDRPGQGEEHLDVQVHAVVQRSVVVAVRHELGKQVPVAGRELGLGPVRPVFGDHLLFVVEPGADVEERLRLSGILVGAVESGRIVGAEL